MAGGNGGLEETPTWAVSIFCLFFFVLSFVIDSGLHHLTEFLKERRRKSLNQALAKIKTEMMKMGCISLLLTISEIPISRICVTEAVESSFLPCKGAVEHVELAVSSATQVSAASGLKPGSNDSLEAADEGSFCAAKGMVPLISRDGVIQLNIFISVLAVFYVSYCLLTLCLGIAKMAKWKSWEEETRTLEHQIAHDPRRFQFTRQTSFGRRHLKFWSRHYLLLWPVCFVRQFRGSILKDDYFTLRHGFIMANISGGSDFNFQKFINRAFDDDFRKVVETRFWIWISMFFIFLSAHEFYNYYWLPFIPLAIVLAVGTKLQVIITQMCVQSCSANSVTRGTCLVKPNNDLFWFGRPKWLLHLIQFIMIQNSFQLAFFAWTWYEFGLRSCFNRETQDIAIRISISAAVHILCGYMTLPLYALVSQMGSGMTKAMFSDHVAEGLKKWRKDARRRLSKGRSIPTITSSRLSSVDNSISDKDMQNQDYELASETATSPPPSSPANVTEDALQYHRIGSESMLKSSAHEITEEDSPVIISKRVVYDGEISFASSWKGSGGLKPFAGRTPPITKGDVSDQFTGFDQWCQSRM